MVFLLLLLTAPMESFSAPCTPLAYYDEVNEVIRIAKKNKLSKGFVDEIHLHITRQIPGYTTENVAKIKKIQSYLIGPSRAELNCFKSDPCRNAYLPFILNNVMVGDVAAVRKYASSYFKSIDVNALPTFPIHDFKSSKLLYDARVKHLSPSNPVKSHMSDRVIAKDGSVSFKLDGDRLKNRIFLGNQPRNHSNGRYRFKVNCCNQEVKVIQKRPSSVGADGTVLEFRAEIMYKQNQFLNAKGEFGTPYKVVVKKTVPQRYPRDHPTRPGEVKRNAHGDIRYRWVATGEEFSGTRIPAVYRKKTPAASAGSSWGYASSQKLATRGISGCHTATCFSTLRRHFNLTNDFAYKIRLEPSTKFSFNVMDSKGVVKTLNIKRQHYKIIRKSDNTTIFNSNGSTNLSKTLFRSESDLLHFESAIRQQFLPHHLPTNSGRYSKTVQVYDHATSTNINVTVWFDNGKLTTWFLDI